jgi:mRNA interferase YafQ
LRHIRRSTRFKKDYKKAELPASDIKVLRDVIKTIACGGKLNRKFHDHFLAGKWKGYRELHLKPNQLLIYKITKDELRLARLGSHSQLFG